MPFLSMLSSDLEPPAVAMGALRSLLTQSHPDWELLVVPSGGEGEVGALGAWRELAGAERRVRILPRGAGGLPELGGGGDSRGALLNHAAGYARGELIGCFDPQLELAPDFLERAAHVPQPYDVLVSGFDVVRHDLPQGPASRFWDPEAQRARFFVQELARPGATLFRRALFERAGGFHPLLWEGEHWELLKRCARLGAEFVFLRGSAGRLHLEGASGQAPRPTGWQRAQIDDNRRRGWPAFGPRSGRGLPKKVERILFASVHCLLDYTNGASLAVLQAFRWLNANGFDARAFCLCEHHDPAREHLGAPAANDLRGKGAAGPDPFQRDEAGLWHTVAAGVPVTVRPVAQNEPWRVTGQTRKFLAEYERLLAEQRPDVVVTYGGDCLSLAMMEAAKFRDIPVVFWLHNFGYPSGVSFQFVDRVIVPSEFSRAYHWDRLGLDCCTLPNFIDWNRVQVTSRQPRFVTFVNPEPVKGGFVFAAIARELALRRPEIPLLVVEGRTPALALRQIGLDLSREALPNVTIVPRTADPREFYAVSKLVLVPSLWNESFGLVAAEAMINGIPVIASDRGALPEVVGEPRIEKGVSPLENVGLVREQSAASVDQTPFSTAGAGGFVLPIPERYTPETRTVPTADEIAPWIETILRLWDDEAFYQAASDRARGWAERWRPAQLGPRFAEFFAHVAPQPAPPLVPR